MGKNKSGNHASVEFVNLCKTDIHGKRLKDKSATLERAQLVRLDEHGRVIYSLPGYRPWRNFLLRNAAVIIPACGVKMLKSKGWLREFMPVNAVRAKEIWQIALAGGFEAVQGGPCWLCKEIDANTRKCAFCLCSFHPACCERAARQPNRSTYACAKPCWWPVLFCPQSLCFLCTILVT